MSAKIALPKQVFGHGFLLNRGEKMSKSVGNVVDPMALAEYYGVDALRYFLLRDVSFGNDGTFSDEAIVTRANADLSNSFGNLAQRTLAFIAKNCEDASRPGGRRSRCGAARRSGHGLCRLHPRVRGSCARPGRGTVDDRACSPATSISTRRRPGAAQDRPRADARGARHTCCDAIRRLAVTIEPVDAGVGGEAAGATGRRGRSGLPHRGADPIFPRLELKEERVNLADSHCHLIYKGLGEQQPEVLARARAAGVVAMLNISTREREWDEVIGVAEREGDVWASVGIHPHEADEHPGHRCGRLVEKARHPRVVGIGETGLDYYRP